MNSPQDDAEIEAWLAAHARRTNLPDEGFSAAVMARLAAAPQTSPMPLAWGRAVGLGALSAALAGLLIWTATGAATVDFDWIWAELLGAAALCTVALAARPLIRAFHITARQLTAAFGPHPLSG